MLRNCGCSSVKASVYNAMQFIFDDETLGERLCDRRRCDPITKSELLTPNGGKKIKFCKLPTLVTNTMNCK
jgi:hypothetical protein